MRVICIKQYKQYVKGTELDITPELFTKNPGVFKQIETLRAKSAVVPKNKYQPPHTEEE